MKIFAMSSAQLSLDDGKHAKGTITQRRPRSAKLERHAGSRSPMSLDRKRRKNRTGFMGRVSTARSAGWGSEDGGTHYEDEEGDDQSQTSRVSAAMSFLSDGFKTLSSKASRVIEWIRTSLKGEESDSGTDKSRMVSEVSSLSDPAGTEPDDDEETSSGSSSRGGGWNSEEMVLWRSARCIQGALRRRLARREASRRRREARDARAGAEADRLERWRQEAQARNRYREACREEGRRILEWAVKCFLQPVMVVNLQRVWRGNRGSHQAQVGVGEDAMTSDIVANPHEEEQARPPAAHGVGPIPRKSILRKPQHWARRRLSRYLRWLQVRARWRRERERYLAALEALGRTDDTLLQQTKRRVWGREEFSHTGWKPQYELENPPSMFDHVWTPPKGNASGIRTHKVILPPRSERQRRKVVEDKNAWAGVPAGIASRPPPPERLGAPPRPGTITDKRVLPTPFGEGDDKRGGNPARERAITMRYSWLPAPLVASVGLLQEPLTEGSDQ